MEYARVVEMDTPASASDLLLAHDGAVMNITLNRPRHKNAMTHDMFAAVIAAVRTAGTDDRTRAVLIDANGKDFCTGVDLVESNERSGDTGGEPRKPRTGHLQRRMQYGVHDMILELDALQVPVVAAVRGWTVGVGMMLALSADVVVASSTTNFWSPFATKGFTPDSGTTWLLPRLIGLARAKEMVLRGVPVDGRTAVEWGMISRCVEDDALAATAAELVQEFARSATIAVGLSKALLNANLNVDLPTALRNEALHEELATRSDDFKEGMRAFAARRPPDYTGR